MTQTKYFTYSMFNSNIHLVQINNVKPLNGAFEEYLQFSDRSAKELKGAMIIDISKGKFLTQKQRAKINEVLISNNEAISKNWTSVAYINTSIISRIVLKGKLRMSPLPVKTNVFTSLDEAVNWSYKVFLTAESRQQE